MMNQIAGYEIEVRLSPDFVRDNEIKVLGGDNSAYRSLGGAAPEFTMIDTLQSMFLAQ